MDLNSIEILNPWWQDSTAIERDSHLLAVKGKAWYFDNPVKRKLSLESSTAFILRGPRQVGKTTLIKEKINEALSTNTIKPKNCILISCEAVKDFTELQEMLALILNPRREEKTLLCLDEITFVKEWQRALLWVSNAGLLTKATSIITGSDAKDLQLNSERFPGRKVTELSVHPFSFGDYFYIPCFNQFSEAELFDIYLRVGGFPHAVSDFSQYGLVTDETHEVYANWIFGDAHKYGLSREILTHILYRIVDAVSSRVTWQGLIEKTPVHSHETAFAYVEHLELSFLCSVLRCFDPTNERGAPRKSKKIYFVDPLIYAIAGALLRGVRNCHAWWLQQISVDDFRGKIFESILVNHALRHTGKEVYYWYSSTLKRELDLLLESNGQIFLYDAKLKEQAIHAALGKPVSVITPKVFIERRGWQD
ncbi:MAG: ATP-binding protein [Deltaproteobacteria bacterium]|nr:ATP-binding protein [Deltaproteobacteria bacterium]